MIKKEIKETIRHELGEQIIENYDREVEELDVFNLKGTMKVLDIKAVYMTYIQLSLLGIPAIIKHGDSLTLKMFDTWYTPSYILQMHKFRRGNNGKCNRTKTL